MRTLYIMRHCKSRWDEPGLGDRERRLTKRGKRDARLLGRALGARSAPPDLILCSPARRARMTARRVARAWGYGRKIRVEEAIYQGGPLQCLEALGALPQEVATVLLIGHNPTLENLVWMLGAPRMPMPTGATVCLDLEIAGWNELDLTTEAQVRFRLEPKALRGQAESEE